MKWKGPHPMWQKAMLAALFGSLVPFVSWSQELDPAQVGILPGQPAPPIVASKWLRGEPIERFEPGMVYVVDMWSTFCRPCILSMPHLARLQSKYAGQARIIAANIWEFMPARVPEIMASLGDSMLAIAFMDSIPRGKEANLGLTAKPYMGDGFVPIPRTFLIDRDGTVVWIGEPDELEGPLTRVIEGTWDVEPFKQRFIAQMKRKVHHAALFTKVDQAIARADWSAAYAACDICAAADSSLVRRASRAFALIARTILDLTEPDSLALPIAQRALNRCHELWGEPSWYCAHLDARLAVASGDLAAARRNYEQALAIAPDEEKAALEEALRALQGR